MKKFLLFLRYANNSFMQEIERKFLVDTAKWTNFPKGNGNTIKQGYVFNEDKGVLRVRITNGLGFLTVKSQNIGATRLEFEYEIPLSDAEKILETMCSTYLSKTRFAVKIGKHTWEIDEFHGTLAPLLLAEIELTSEDEPFELPDFVLEEVTSDKRYYNSELIKRLEK